MHVSSAYMYIVQLLTTLLMLFTCIVYPTGPYTDPVGTPNLTLACSPTVPSLVPSIEIDENIQPSISAPLQLEPAQIANLSSQASAAVMPILQNVEVEEDVQPSTSGLPQIEPLVPASLSSQRSVVPVSKTRCSVGQRKRNTGIKILEEKIDKLRQKCKTQLKKILFPLFDTPHLLKGVRNNLLTKNAIFIQNGKEKVAKWEHLKMLLAIDVGEDEIRLVNKLTESHVIKDKIKKMKVKLAAQVFSQRVSSALGFLARHGVLPAECQDTADFLLIFDKLFDSFNGHSYQTDAKKYKCCGLYTDII
ncbi:uncharacterized protein ACR2FA_001294 [Aphomia sociella]